MNYSRSDVSITSWGWIEDADGRTFRTWKIRAHGDHIGYISTDPEIPADDLVALAETWARLAG